MGNKKKVNHMLEVQELFAGRKYFHFQPVVKITQKRRNIPTSIHHSEHMQKFNDWNIKNEFSYSKQN